MDQKRKGRKMPFSYLFPRGIKWQRKSAAGFSPHRVGDADKGDILFLEREFFLFRTGANVNAAQVPRDATPIFFPEKENGRRPSKRKAFPIASEQLEELQCLPIALPIARRCRV